MKCGLMVYATGGTIDGSRGAHVFLARPYILASEYISTIVERLSAAANDTF